jgi:DNA-directed RNA polymerase subunit E'/Rpb7
MENIYFKSILKRRVVVDPKYLNEHLDEYIQGYLKNKLEGKCIYEGYIKPDSIRLLKRSAGFLLGSRFTGDLTYEVAYTADICNPSEGNVVECKAEIMNKTGILGHNGPLTILIGKELHDSSRELKDAYDRIKVGDVVKVQVIGKMYSLQDKEIRIFGKLHGVDFKKNKGKSNRREVEEEVKKEEKKVMDEENEDEEEDVDDVEFSDSEEDEEGSQEGSEGSEETEESEEEEEEEEGIKVGGNTILKGAEFGDDFSDYADEEVDEEVDDGGDDGDEDDGGYGSD